MAIFGMVLTKSFYRGLLSGLVLVRHHRGSDAWGRGSYSIPDYAVVGSSDTGMSYDSPCPSDKVEAELNVFRGELLKHGISSHYSSSQSGNLFMAKQWVVVSSKDFKKASEIAIKYLADHDYDTRYIHDADLLGPE